MDGLTSHFNHFNHDQFQKVKCSLNTKDHLTTMSGSERREAGGVSARLLALSDEAKAQAEVKPLDPIGDAIAQMEKLFPLTPLTLYEVDVKQKAPRGVWLTAELDKYKSSNGITEDTKPSEEMIRKQIFLPAADQPGFQEPIKSWEEVRGDHKLPDLDEETKKTLPDEENEPREQPKVYRDWFNTHQYVTEFEDLAKPVKLVQEFKLEDKENPVKVCQEWVENNNNMDGDIILNYKDGVVR